MTTHSLFIGTELGHRGRLEPDFVETALASIKRAAAQRFGGYTLYRTEGGWVTPSGILHEERGVRLDVVDRADREIEMFARWAGRCLEQQSVLVTSTEGTSQFVDVKVAEVA